MLFNTECTLFPVFITALICAIEQVFTSANSLSLLVSLIKESEKRVRFLCPTRRRRRRRRHLCSCPLPFRKLFRLVLIYGWRFSFMIRTWYLPCLCITIAPVFMYSLNWKCNGISLDNNVITQNCTENQNNQLQT